MERKNQTKITLEGLYAYLHKSEEKNNREFEKRERAREKREREREKRERDREKRREEWDRGMKELRESQKETDKKIREVTIQLGGIGNSNGEVAEEYFINAFKENPSLNGEIYNEVIHNARFKPADRQKRSEYNDEFDIFLSNDQSAAIIEIKYNVKKGDISSLLEKGKNYREYFLDDDDFKLYLGIAALSFRKTTEKNILNQGIAVIKQVAGKMVINSENLKEF